MSLQLVHDALVAAAVSAVGAIPMERENWDFQKPTNDKWTRLSFLPNVPTVETLGTSGEDMATGILQVDFFYPKNTGDADVGIDTETFRAAFKAGSSFVSGSQAAHVKSCGRSPAHYDENWFFVSITAEWWALVPR